MTLIQQSLYAASANQETTVHTEPSSGPTYSSIIDQAAALKNQQQQNLQSEQQAQEKAMQSQQQMEAQKEIQ